MIQITLVAPLGTHTRKGIKSPEQSPLDFQLQIGHLQIRAHIIYRVLQYIPYILQSLRHRNRTADARHVEATDIQEYTERQPEYRQLLPGEVR